MPIEAALIKPLVDALLALFRQAGDVRLKRDAEAAVRDAIRELLRANPDEHGAEAGIAIAKAAGILSGDVVLAEDMLRRHRETRARTRGKVATGRRRRRGAAPPEADPAHATRAEPAPTRKVTIVGQGARPAAAARLAARRAQAAPGPTCAPCPPCPAQGADGTDPRPGR